MLAFIIPVRVFLSRVRRPTVAKCLVLSCALAVQLLDEGAVQMLRERSDDGNGNPILAAVGTLQFDGELAFSEHGSGAPVPILDWTFTQSLEALDYVIDSTLAHVCPLKRAVFVLIAWAV